MTRKCFLELLAIAYIFFAAAVIASVTRGETLHTVSGLQSDREYEVLYNGLSYEYLYADSATVAQFALPGAGEVVVRLASTAPPPGGYELPPMPADGNLVWWQCPPNLSAAVGWVAAQYAETDPLTGLVHHWTRVNAGDVVTIPTAPGRWSYVSVYWPWLPEPDGSLLFVWRSKMILR